MKTVILMLALLPVGLHATGKTHPQPAPGNDLANVYEPMVAGVVALGAEAFIHQTRLHEPADPVARYLDRLLVPAVIGFALGQWAGSFTSGPDRSAQDIGAALAGSQVSITLHW